MNKYVTEFIGTFFLVFSIGMAVTSGNPLGPLAIGATLMVMVYMGGHVSGAPLQPRGNCGCLPARQARGRRDRSVHGRADRRSAGRQHDGSPSGGAGFRAGTVQVLVAEILMTFALVLVILNVATAKATEGNSYYGLAIGFTVTVGAFAVGPISGGAFNPAVGTGPILANVFIGAGGIENL